MLSQKIHHFFDLGYELIYRHIVLILLILLCLGIGIGLAGSYKLSMNIMEVQAQQNAEISITTINETRALYSEQIAQRLKNVEGVTLSPEYHWVCLLYTSPSPRDLSTSRMPSSA